MKFRLLPAIAIMFSFALNILAHEYWIEPGTFFPSPGEKTPLHLYVGDGIDKEREERVYQREMTTMFQLFGISKVWNLKTTAIEGATPVQMFSAEKAGNYLVAMERKWAYIKLEPEKFEDYLREDGMDYIIGERAALGESEKIGRERYSRFLKSLLQAGATRDATFKKRLGQKLEIIPMENPYSKNVGDSLTLQVFFDGKPLADRTVFAENRESKTQKMVTGKNGEFTVKLEKSGLWLARLVIMQRCKAECGEADWESFWGAFSFGVK